jgi:hypothetical protein
MLKNGEVEAVAYDKPVLQSMRKEDAEMAHFAIGKAYKDLNLGAVYQEGSKLKDALHIAVIHTLDDTGWMLRSKAAHFGDGSPPDILDVASFPWGLLATTIGVVFIFSAAQFWPVDDENRNPDKIRRKSGIRAAAMAIKSAEACDVTKAEALDQGMSNEIFDEIDADGDGVLTGLEVSAWQLGNTLKGHKHNIIGPTARALPPLFFADGKAAAAGPQIRALPEINLGKKAGKERLANLEKDTQLAFPETQV